MNDQINHPALRETARRAVLDVLDTNQLPAARPVPSLHPAMATHFESVRWQSCHELLTTRDDLEKRIDRAVAELMEVKPYLHGERGAFNALGLLRGEGSAIDRLCGLFAEQVERAIDAEYQVQLALALGRKEKA